MGGTVDPKTGEVVWEMHVPLEQQLAHYRSHPPSALKELRATPIECDFQFDGHGEPVNAIFELACPCGGTRFVADCGVDDGEACSPISIHCDACEAVYEIFDAALHGFDPQLNPEEPVEPEYTDDLINREVGIPHEIVVRYEFPSDHLGGDPEYAGREHDLFSWFTILARDAQTRRLAFLFDAECA